MEFRLFVMKKNVCLIEMWIGSFCISGKFFQEIYIFYIAIFKKGIDNMKFYFIMFIYK